MFKTTAKIDGMMCGMCEAHVNEALRSKLSIKKVSSSHKKGESVIISESGFTAEQLAAALEGSGYKLLSVQNEPYEKKRLFSRK